MWLDTGADARTLGQPGDDFRYLRSDVFDKPVAKFATTRRLDRERLRMMSKAARALIGRSGQVAAGRAVTTRSYRNQDSAMGSVDFDSTELSQSFTLTEGGRGAAFIKWFTWSLQNRW